MHAGRTALGVQGAGGVYSLGDQVADFKAYAGHRNPSHLKTALNHEAHWGRPSL